MKKEMSNQQITVENREGIRLCCQHCYHEWTYFGKSPFYACCSRCRYPVSVKNCIVKEDFKT